MQVKTLTKLLVNHVAPCPGGGRQNGDAMSTSQIRWPITICKPNHSIHASDHLAWKKEEVIYSILHSRKASQSGSPTSLSRTTFCSPRVLLLRRPDGGDSRPPPAAQHRTGTRDRNFARPHARAKTTQILIWRRVEPLSADYQYIIWSKMYGW